MNLMPNSQFQIRTTTNYFPRYNASATALSTPVSISSYVPGSPSPVLYTSNTQDLKQGDLISISGSPDAAFNLCALELTSCSPGVGFTVTNPRNLFTGTSHACTATVMTQGIPDNYYCSGTVTAWIDTFAVNNLPGCPEQVGLKLNSSTSPVVFMSLFDTIDSHRLRGQTITFGIYVLQKIGTGTVQPYIVTDTSAQVTGSNYSFTSGQYAYQEVTATIPNNANSVYVGIQINGVAGDTYYVSQPTCRQDTTALPYSFDQKIFYPATKITPLGYIYSSFTLPTTPDGCGFYGFPINLYQETNGAIAKSVRSGFVMLEGKSSSVGSALGLRNKNAIPVIYAPAIYAQVANTMDVCGGILTFNCGSAWIYSQNPGVTFNGVSLDVDTFYL